MIKKLKLVAVFDWLGSSAIFLLDY